MAIKFIDEAVLVHCAAGVSRSGGIILAYLMWKMLWSFDNAWLYARTKRPKIYPNKGFQK